MALGGDDCLSLNLQWQRLLVANCRREGDISNEVKGVSTPLPTLFFLAAPFLTSIFLSLSILKALSFKSLSTQCLGRLFCRTEEQGWSLGWIDEEALIGHWLWHLPPYSSITLLRPLANPHLSCQSLTWEQNVNQISLFVCVLWAFVLFFLPLFLHQVPIPAWDSELEHLALLVQNNGSI